MECACEIDVDVDGYSEMVTDEKRTAAKYHKCSECGDAIQPGDIYEYYRGVWEGSFFTNKTCVDCLSIRETFFTGSYYFGQIMEYFNEFVGETSGEIPEDCISALTPKAQEIVCSAINREWEHCWLNNPTQPAVRFDLMKGKTKQWLWPEWVHQRHKEMTAMDGVV